MADEVDLRKTFCLFDFTHFVKLHVKSEATEEELQNVKLRRTCLPRIKLHPLGPTTETQRGTSFLALDSMICCVACPKSCVVPNKEVKIFNPNAQELKFDTSFPKMNEERSIPAVAAIGRLVYVFGGLPLTERTKPERIWAEYLDISQSRDKQAWVALPKPPFHIQEHFPVAFPLGDEEILIIGNNMTKNDLLYNVKYGSWTVYKLMDGYGDLEALYASKPVLVGAPQTIYWLFGCVLCAFELESKKFYRGIMHNSGLHHYCTLDYPDYGDPTSAVLMHLKGDVFCFFTFYNKVCDSDTNCGTLECTKIRVAKTDLASGDHGLEIDVIGYQSYQCGNMWSLYGGVPIAKCINGSKKRRNRHRKKHKG